MAQDITFCPSTTAEVLPGVLGLLPPGRAWAAADQPGTNQNHFWTAVASVTAGIVKDLCAFRLELFCSTVVQSRDQWVAEYYLNDPIGAWNDPALLCARVTLKGGARCADLTRILASAGYVVTDCHEPVSYAPSLAIAGCMAAGCTILGPRPVRMVDTPCARDQCAYGSAVNHPQPAIWKADTPMGNGPCKRPGSRLGRAHCCTTAGEFGVQPDPALFPREPDACVPMMTVRYALPVSF